MSYKDEIKKEMQALLLKTTESTCIPFYTYLEGLYAKAIYESRKTGQSIESITYEILEGLEESYEAYPHEVEKLLENCSRLMIEVIHRSSINTLERKNKKFLQAKAQLLETLEAEKAYLTEAHHTFKNYAEDNRHLSFQKSIHQREADIIKKINMLSDYSKGST